MEKHGKPKNKILKYLPKAASVVNFQNPPFSPGRDKRSDITGKHKCFAGRGFSGPMIPDEARRKSKNESFEKEPTSPKVSCMGQIKQRKIKAIKKAKCSVPPPKESKPVNGCSSSGEAKKHVSKLRRLFSMGKELKKSDVSSINKSMELCDKAPSLGQMKRFASGRDAFAGFDWMAQIAPMEADQRDYYSDEERRDCDFDDDDDDDEVIIPFSAPITVGGDMCLQPRKEINLWKRRTMNPPRPLQLNPVVSSN